MAGTLTIHSKGDGSIMSGHSWIEYTPDNGTTKTYGTWGNNPTGTGNGLFENLELLQSPGAMRTVHITDEQEKQLFAKIKEYKDKGKNAWGWLSPCSAFAADVWKAATGESLAHRSGIISNPSKLRDSIVAANANDLKKATAPDPKPNPKRPQSSRRNCGSSVTPCTS